MMPWRCNPVLLCQVACPIVTNTPQQQSSVTAVISVRSPSRQLPWFSLLWRCFEVLRWRRSKPCRVLDSSSFSGVSQLALVLSPVKQLARVLSAVKRTAETALLEQNNLSSAWEHLMLTALDILCGPSAASLHATFCNRMADSTVLSTEGNA